MKKNSLFLAVILVFLFIATANAERRHGMVICENPGYTGCLTDQDEYGFFHGCLKWREYIKESVGHPLYDLRVERLELVPKSQLEDADSHYMYIYFTFIEIKEEHDGASSD